MARKIGSYNYSFEFKLEVLNDLFTSSDSNVMIAKKYKIHPKTVSS
jgi:transposase-like protein